MLRIEAISFKRDPASIYGGTGTETEIGFSAQQVQTVIPEAVFETVMATPDPADRRGPLVPQPPVLGVIPQPLIAALFNAVRELDGRLRALESPAAGLRTVAIACCTSSGKP